VLPLSNEVLRGKLHGYFVRDPRLRSVAMYTKQRFEAATTLTAHNWEHIYRDTLNAIVIGEAERADMGVVLPAIVMHDIGYLAGPEEGHGPRGAKMLPDYLKVAGVAYSAEEVARQASCIHTHKGSRWGERPEGIEAKVVADADLLAKFGPLGVYQTIRALGEFDWSLADLLARATVRQTEPLVLETETGRRLAEPGRRFVSEFYRALALAAEPYKDPSL
jgi:HD superfamily phosphodiesterase